MKTEDDFIPGDLVTYPQPCPVKVGFHKIFVVGIVVQTPWPEAIWPVLVLINGEIIRVDSSEIEKV